MKLIKKLQDGMMNTDLAFGGCPICGGKNTLTNVGSTFKPCIECNACGSKFEQCSIGSPKYKMIEGSSDHLGEELTVKEWSLVRAGNLGGAAVQPLKPNQVVITSEYPADVTRDKVTSVFRRFGFEVDKTGDEYYAHKGNFLTGLLIGFLLPKHDIYYSLSEAEGKTMVNLRAVVGFWKGGGAFGMHKQESAFKKIVAAISADLCPVVEGNSGTGVVADEMYLDDIVNTKTIRKIVATICTVIGVLAILTFGIIGIIFNLSTNRPSGDMIYPLVFIAIGTGFILVGRILRK